MHTHTPMQHGLAGCRTICEPPLPSFNLFLILHWLANEVHPLQGPMQQLQHVPFIAYLRKHALRSRHSDPPQV